MSALTVLIIRHAEKPEGDWPGPGLTLDGQPDEASLVVRGWQRAGAWAALFSGASRDTYPTPAVIYAADPTTNPAGQQPSSRPAETITPLADRLRLEPVTRWGRGAESQLASEVRGLTGPILICWEHKLIASQLLPALLMGQLPAGVPTKWHGSRFDVVLRLDRAMPGAPWSFRQLFPRLLSGDSDVPL